MKAFSMKAFSTQIPVGGNTLGVLYAELKMLSLPRIGPDPLMAIGPTGSARTFWNMQSCGNVRDTSSLMSSTLASRLASHSANETRSECRDHGRAPRRLPLTWLMQGSSQVMTSVHGIPRDPQFRCCLFFLPQLNFSFLTCVYTIQLLMNVNLAPARSMW